MPLIGSLSLREHGSDRLVLALPGGHRVLFGLLSALSIFILCAGVLFEGETTVLLPRNAVPGLLVLATLFGLLYEDRWTFDRARGRVENRFGTLFLARRTGFPMAELERIAVDRFTRGRIVEAPADAQPSTAAGGSPFAGAVPRRRWGVVHQQRIVRLVAVGRAGEVHVVDAGPAHRLAVFRNRGLRIAGFCGVRFEDATAGAGPTARSTGSTPPGGPA